MKEFTRPVYEGDGKRLVRSFVRRQGRMTDARWKEYQNLRQKYSVPFTPKLSDLAAEFPKTDQPLVVEIGFGMGHATADIAAANPEVNYLGIEVHTPGVAALLKRAEDRNLENLRVIEHDAVEVFHYMIADSSIGGVHVFFPDPWPKKRHFKRRLIQEPFLRMLESKLRTGGYIYAATDWEDYAEWMMEHFAKVETLANAYDGYAPSIEWRPRTAFEQKGLDKQHLIRELYFLKK